MAIAGELQTRMWREMETFLNERRALPPRELCKQCFLWMFDNLQRYPMLQQADGETAEYLYRKLPPEVIAAHSQDDSHELVQLQAYGIHFQCGIEIATQTLQTLAITFLNLQQEQAPQQRIVMELILDGVLKEIVSDERD